MKPSLERSDHAVWRQSPVVAESVQEAAGPVEDFAAVCAKIDRDGLRRRGRQDSQLGGDEEGRDSQDRQQQGRKSDTGHRTGHWNTPKADQLHAEFGLCGFADTANRRVQPGTIAATGKDSNVLQHVRFPSDSLIRQFVMPHLTTRRGKRRSGPGRHSPERQATAR